MLSWLGRRSAAEKSGEQGEDLAKSLEKAKKPEAAIAVKERPSADGPLLSVRNVERSFDVGSQKIRVLKGINLNLYPSQLVMLRGRSGSGKTTLMNLMGGLDTPTKGEIFSKTVRSISGMTTSALSCVARISALFFRHSP